MLDCFFFFFSIAQVQERFLPLLRGYKYFSNGVYLHLFLLILVVVVACAFFYYSQHVSFGPFMPCVHILIVALLN